MTFLGSKEMIRAIQDESVMIYASQDEPNFHLSENFMSWEFRCHCCGVVKVYEGVVSALEELRAIVDGPLYVNSGYRCPAHNRAVGGAKNSYHMRGMAADIWSETVSPKVIAGYAMLIPAIQGIGLYRNFVHVDVRVESAYWISNVLLGDK
jgi:hypothetical protein